MAKVIIPGAGETVELLVETIRQRIIERIDEVNISKSLHSAKIAKNLTKSQLKINQPTVYRTGQRLNKQLKSLKRGLGGLLTSDPEAVINPKTGDTWGKLVHDLVDKNVTGDQLATKLATFGSFVDQSKNVVPGKVGHHRTALNILRDILKDKPFEYRKAFKAIADSAGYKIGEEFVDFIDPAVHKEFTTKVGGELAKRLGVTNVSQVPKSLLNSLADRYAHAARFGSTTGWEVPANFLKQDVNPEKLFSFAQPYLEAAQRGADSALELEDIVTKGKWETAGDLEKLVNKVKIRDTSDILDHFGKPLYRGAESGVTGKDLILPEGIKGSDIDPAYLEKHKLANNITIKSNIKPNNTIADVPGINVKKAAKRLAIANVGGKILTHAGRAAATPLVGGEQGKAAGNLARTGDTKYAKDLAIATGVDIAAGSAFGVTAKAIAQKQLTKGLIKKGLARGVLGAVGGPVGWALLGYSAVDTANAFTKAYTGKGFVGHAKELFIKNQDDPAKGVQIASN